MSTQIIEGGCATCGGAVFGVPGAAAAVCERDAAWRPILLGSVLDTHVVGIDRAEDMYTLADGRVMSGAEIQRRAAEEIK